MCLLSTLGLLFFFPLTAGDNKAPMVAVEEEDDEVPGQNNHTSPF